MTAIILIAVAFAGFKIGSGIVRIGRALHLPGFGSGKLLFNVNN